MLLRFMTRSFLLDLNVACLSFRGVPYVVIFAVPSEVVGVIQIPTLAKGYARDKCSAVCTHLCF